MYRFLFVLIATLSWTLSAAAQPSMQLPDEVGLIDHPRTLVVDLDTGDLLIEAYSFDVCHACSGVDSCFPTLSTSSEIRDRAS